MIMLSLRAEGDTVHLSVVDNGTPVPDEALSQLFNEVIFSDNGFGIGLYQSSQVAKRAGYKLLLESNYQGNVCFSLTNKSSPDWQTLT